MAQDDDAARLLRRAERRTANIRSLADEAREALDAGSLDIVEDRLRRVLGYIDSFAK